LGQNPERGNETAGLPEGVVRTSLQKIFATGGVTINPRVEPTSGFAFAFKKATELRIEVGDLTKEQYVQKVEDALEAFLAAREADFQQADTYLGGWKDGETVVLDVSMVLADKQEALRRAELSDQDAIFDLNTFEEILTNRGRERRNAEKQVTLAPSEGANKGRAQSPDSQAGGGSGGGSVQGPSVEKPVPASELSVKPAETVAPAPTEIPGTEAAMPKPSDAKEGSDPGESGPAV